METKITGNEPANVIDGMYAADARRGGTAGLTIRQRFAMEVMNGYVSNGNSITSSEESIAKYAVEQADALIKALNEIPNPNI